MKALTLTAAVVWALAFATQQPIYGADCCEAVDTCCDSACCDCDSCCDLGCDSGCDSVMSCCDPCSGCGMKGKLCDCMGRMKLLGLIKPSDHCFDDFVSPMINFVFFEDPRTLTEIRPIFVHHNLPRTLSGGAVGADGAVQLFAVQFRIALTERLSIIAVKDGFIVDRVKNGGLDALLDDGWADVSAGLKYNVLRDTCSGTLASVGFTYEMPVGSRRALQRNGDGEFHLFATAGQRLMDGNAHWLSAFGWRKPVDGQSNSESIHWSNHFDVRMTEKAYLVTELAWWHWVDSAATGLPLMEAGQDLFNLPTTNTTNNDLVTQSVGFKYKPKTNIEAGFSYEFPLTSFRDVIKDRIQLEMIVRY